MKHTVKTTDPQVGDALVIGGIDYTIYEVHTVKESLYSSDPVRIVLDLRDGSDQWIHCSVKLGTELEVTRERTLPTKQNSVISNIKGVGGYSFDFGIRRGNLWICGEDSRRTYTTLVDDDSILYWEES